MSEGTRTKIKLCGLTRPQDIAAANALLPDYIGFVFAEKSRRYLSPEQAAQYKQQLDPRITAVGVFVDEPPINIAQLLESGVIDAAQLHGHEDEAYITTLRNLTRKPLIQAFRIRTEADIQLAMASTADEILLDGGSGNGFRFNWDLLSAATRSYFLAGGLSPENIAEAIRKLRPYAVDVSSGIETEGKKDADKMFKFCEAVREAERV
jgi:phosphoribosylanthranilate isomerase